MFKKFTSNNNNPQEQYNYYDSQQLGRIYYELEEINRKLRNLNNRLRRIENFLGLANDEQNNSNK